jgi:hypothetical protein
MANEYSDQQLQAFLDEALPAECMVEIETRLRCDAELVRRVARLRGEREAGLHSLGEIWRRHRLTCPSRQQLGGYLLGVLDDHWAAYIRCHVEQVGCRVCAANLADLQEEQKQQVATAAAAISARQQRRQRYFQSSAGYLRSAGPE